MTVLAVHIRTRQRHGAKFASVYYFWLVLQTMTRFCHPFSSSVRSQPNIATVSTTGYINHGFHNSPKRLYLSPEVFVGGGLVMAGVAGWLYVDSADDRQRRNQRQEEEERYRQYQEERSRKAYIEPKDFWTEDELAEYDGSRDEDGPILLAADGLVFNVYKGRNFYGPGGEYHLFSGRDATRFLAKKIVEEESPEEAARPLNMAERASLAAWLFTLKGKYEIVGKLKGFDPKTTSMKTWGS